MLKEILNEEDYKSFKNLSRNLLGFSGISVEVISVDESKKIISLSIRQIVKLTDKIYEGHEMKKFVAPFVEFLKKEGWAVELTPLPFKSDEIGNISAQWVKSKMHEYGFSQRQLAKEMELDEFVISKLLSNKVGFTRWHKATFNYFFKLIDLEIKYKKLESTFAY